MRCRRDQRADTSGGRAALARPAFVPEQQAGHCQDERGAGDCQSEDAADGGEQGQVRLVHAEVWVLVELDLRAHRERGSGASVVGQAGEESGPALSGATARRFIGQMPERRATAIELIPRLRNATTRPLYH